MTRWSSWVWQDLNKFRVSRLGGMRAAHAEACGMPHTGRVYVLDGPRPRSLSRSTIS